MLRVEWIPKPDEGFITTRCPDCKADLVYPGRDEDKIQKFYGENAVLRCEPVSVRVSPNIYNAAFRCPQCGHAWLGNVGHDNEFRPRLIFSK